MIYFVDEKIKLNHCKIDKFTQVKTKQNKTKKKQYIGLIHLFNGMSTFVGYLMPKIFWLKKEKKWYFL